MMIKIYKMSLVLCLLTVIGVGKANAQKTYDRKDSTSVVGSFLQNINATKMVFGKINTPQNGDDLLILGNTVSPAAAIIRLYKNDGVGNFTQRAESFELLTSSNASWSDKDGNILITGLNGSSVKTTNLYVKNVGTGQYELAATPVVGGSALQGITGFSGFGDFNNDGRDDILLWDNATGSSYVYLKTSGGEYSLVTNPLDNTSNFPLLQLNSSLASDIAIGDYNVDGRADFAIAGKIGTTSYTSLYKSNGDGTFSKVSITLDGAAADFTGLSLGAISFGDIDGDGAATDLLVMGNTTPTGTVNRNIKLYKQDAVNRETYTTKYTFANGNTGQYTQSGGKRYGQVIFADLDGDGKANDFITTGQNAAGRVTTEIFINKKDAANSYNIYSRYGSSAYIPYNGKTNGVNIDAFNSFIWDHQANANYRYFAFGDITGDGTRNDIAKWGQATNMAALYVYNNVPLPVTLSSFTAKAENSAARLSWSTQSEKDNKEFIISRSTNAINFTELKRIAGAGTSNQEIKYQFIDNAPLSGINYYKLTQVDFDGTVKELGVKPLRFGLAGNTVIVSPNPTKDKATVAIAAGTYTKYSVIGFQGNILTSGTIGNTDTQVEINLSSLATGTYVIKLTGAGGNTATRIIKL